MLPQRSFQLGGRPLFSGLTVPGRTAMIAGKKKNGGKNDGGGNGNGGYPGWGNPQGITSDAPLPYGNSKAQAKHAYQQAMAALAQQKDQTLQYYGYRVNKKGQYVMDAQNQYGALQMLGRTQGAALNQLTNAQVQSGLTGHFGAGTGLAQQQRNEAQFAQGYEQAQLLKEFQDKMQAIRLGRREARWQRNQDTVSGTLQSILSAIAGGQFTPAPPFSGGF